MGKKITVVLLVLALALVGGASTALAQGPSGTYVSGVSCVNLTSNSASIVVEAFKNADDGGGSLGSFSDAIPGDGNKQYFTGGSDALAGLLPDGTVGSVVISSGQPIACSLNTQTSGGTARTGTSNGISADDTASTVFAPQVLRYTGVFNSYVAVQNAGGPDTTVTAKFFNAQGVEVTAAQQSASVPANSTHVFYQDTNTALGSTFNGSATFESNNGAKLAGTVVLFDDSSTLLAYDAFSSGSPTVKGPRFVKNISNVQLYSGLACQNVSGSSTTITADFNIGGVTGTESKTVADKQSFLFSAKNFTDPNLAAITAGFGSVTVDGGGGNIACTFNENATTGIFAGTGSTYNGLPATVASNTVSFPQVVALGSSSFRGGFQYANTTGTATTCSHTYVDKTSGTLGTISGVSLAANGSKSVFAETEMAGSSNPAISGKATSFNGSVTVSCGQPIVGIYNLSAVGVLTGDSFTTNTGVNR